MILQALKEFLLIVKNMIAKVIKALDLKSKDEVIIVWYDGGGAHGIIQSLDEPSYFSSFQYTRKIKIGGAGWLTISNSDDVYLINRPDKESIK